MWLSVSLVSRTALTVFDLFFRHIYVVVSFFGFWNSSNSVWFIFQTYIYIYLVVSFFGFWNSSNSVWFIFQTYIYIYIYIYMWLSVSLVSGTALTVFGLFFRHIYIYICGCQFLWFLEQL